MREPLLLRTRVTQATVDAWKGRPFAWGKSDCVRMVAAHLRRAGHKVMLPPASSYRSALTAKRRLADRGFANLAAAMDAMGFERIAPARALVGDVIAGEGDEIGSLGVQLTNGRLLAFHEDAVGAEIIQPVEFSAAWGVPFNAEAVSDG